MNIQGYSAGLWVFSAGGPEKFGGYTQSLSVQQQIELAASIPDLKGLELISPLHVSRDNAKEVKGWLDDAGVKAVAVNPYVWTEAIWQRGAFTSPDSKVRQAAIDAGKEAIEIGNVLETRRMCLWPGEDGYDYHFQVDYKQIWEWETEGVRQLAEFDPETRIGIEYKPSEPRTHQLVNTAAKAALIGCSLGLPNVGGYLDFGHAILSGEVPAESAAILAGMDRLVGVHVNDNFGAADDDIMVGSVHFWSMIEFFLVLEEVGYDGWISLDLVPTRENPADVSALSIAAMKNMEKLIGRLDRNALRQAQNEMDAIVTQKIVQEMIKFD